MSEYIMQCTTDMDGIDCYVRTGVLIRCKDCKNSEHWYRDRRRCFLWAESGVAVFDDGFCNYAERRQDDEVRSFRH